MIDPIPYEFPDFLNCDPIEDVVGIPQPLDNNKQDQQQLSLDEEIKLAIMTLDDESPIGSILEEENSEFDTPQTIDTEQTNETEEMQLRGGTPGVLSNEKVNLNTITNIKEAMINTSKLLSLYTTLKTTYLKLCKEFNYLLGKFNENEKIKIELIHENNELRRLLYELIKEREMERKDRTNLHI